MTRPDRCRRCHGYDYGGHGAWCWYDRQASWQRAAERREARARFGEPLKLGERPEPGDKLLRFKAVDTDGNVVGIGACPACGDRVEIIEEEFVGEAEVECWELRCDWTGTWDYSEEREAVA